MYVSMYASLIIKVYLIVIKKWKYRRVEFAKLRVRVQNAHT